ncbi:Galactose/lactose metabolism regulatory protein GAL80 [Grifola frondosa]|uniref:Galactose/lactose metabolism regulatory protein GAL80 n=1 Tax=Grifola frondosa TaxID=5627 RepID=A0A1C7MBQ3_GRIFR|nr:Galactose/lactose metabolism regulatory protein GAL80 [Grifola frondosa]
MHDLSPVCCASAAEKYSKLTSAPVKAYHGSTDDIADDPNVDLVVVAVKVPDHKAAVMPAIEKGKDVFVECPLGMTLQETMEIAEAAQRKGVRSIVGLQSWQSPLVRKVKEWISAGKIGKVLSCTWVGSKTAEVAYWAPYHKDRAVYAAYPENGTTVLQVTIGHTLSALISALGPLSSISSACVQRFDTIEFVTPDMTPTGNIIKSTVPDQYAFCGVFKDSGAVLSAICRGGVPVTGESGRGRPSLVWLIDGDKGCIRAESSHVTGSFLHVTTPEKIFLNGEEMNVDDGEDKLDNMGREWLEFAKGAEGYYPTFDDAVLVYKHIDAIARSAREGRRIDLDI